MQWQRDLAQQFQGRIALSPEQLVTEFGVSAQAKELLLECLTLFTEEYGVQYSLLRRNDSLELFVNPIRQGNPVEAFFSQAAVQDRVSELNYRLKKRRKLLAQPLEKAPMTVGEYVRAWIGPPL